MYGGRQQQGSGCVNGMTARLLIGAVIVGFALISYFFSKEYNPITGEDQHIAITKDQEIALGQQSAPELIREFGGLYQDQQVQDQIDEIGFRIVENSVARDQGWVWDFHVLNQPDVINAFALPGGQVFITTGLIQALGGEEENVAGVIAHEIVHVLARHSAQQMAKYELTNGLIGAVAVATGDANAAQTAAVIGQLINMKYGRDDEHQSDTIGVCLMIDADYDPNAMLEVMQVLAEASGGEAPPEFMSTHPSPENRLQRIQDQIANADSRCNYVD